MSQKRVGLVTGCTGQDGSLMAELLLKKDYKVYGLKRRSSSDSLGCSAHLKGLVEFIEGDLLDLSGLTRMCGLVRPHEFYNFAAMSHVHTSFEQPIYTAECTGVGVLNCLEAIRQSGIHTKFLQASSSEMFGGVQGNVPLDESTPFHPRSPYGSAKAFGFWSTVNYRETYRIHACNSICFNHEAPGRRGPTFVTRKITLGIRDIMDGKIKKIRLGNLDAMRDWSHAEDIVDGVYRIINYKDPDDYVLASGNTHSVRYFCKIAFEYAGLGNYEPYIEIDPLLYRPCEVNILIGNASKAKNILGWEPKHTFEDLVKEMIDSDCKEI